MKTEFDAALAAFTAGAKPLTAEEQRLVDATMADLERMFASQVMIRAVPIIDKISLSPIVPTRLVSHAELATMFDYRVHVMSGGQVAAGIYAATTDDDKPKANE